jgi:hypothetical protein
MKKTIKFFSMAALVMLGAMTVSCSSDNDELLSEQPVNNKDNVVTTTLTVDLDDATTRALTDGGDKTFEVGDQIAVLYKNTSSEYVKAVSVALTAGDIYDGTHKKALFTVSLNNPMGNANFCIVYPASMAKENPTAIDFPSNCFDYDLIPKTQDGTWATASSYDVCASDISQLTNGGSLPNTKYTLYNKTAIAKFTFKGSDGNGIKNITQLKFITPDHKNEYTVNSTGLNEIYVAMVPFTANTPYLTFEAATATKTYTKIPASNVAFTAGHITPIRLTVYEYKALSAATADELGWVVGSDGKIYSDKTTAEAAGTTANAMIAYVGNKSNCTNGLAFALEDLNGGWFDPNNKDGVLSTFATAHPVTGGTWRIPSADDIKYMIEACGGSAYTSTLANDQTIDNLGTLNTKLYNAGGTGGSGLYGSMYVLSNTDDGFKWFFDFTTNIVFHSYNSNPNSALGRAVLAF